MSSTYTSSDQSCRAALAEWMEYLEQVETPDQEVWEKVIQKYPECESSLRSYQELWNSMAQIPVPEPSEAMHTRFYAMLDGYEAAQKRGLGHKMKQIAANIRQSMFSLQALRYAYAVILFGIGIGTGFWLNSKQTNNQIQMLSSEIQDLNQMNMMTLLEQPSASERLKGIHLTRRMENPTDKVVDALLETLNNDLNANVRLVALETLLEFADQAVVREGLLRSISQQDNPLVQVALAEAMITLQEKGAVAPLQKLLESDSVDGNVKEKVESSINMLM